MINVERGFDFAKMYDSGTDGGGIEDYVDSGRGLSAVWDCVGSGRGLLIEESVKVPKMPGGADAVVTGDLGRRREYS